MKSRKKKIPRKKEPRKEETAAQPDVAVAPPVEGEAEAGPSPAAPPFPVVAIGASAGGLEAMTELIAALPSGLGMAFVFLQHASPVRESMLTQLLARATTMPIQEIRTGMRVEPDRAYVAPSGMAVDIEDGAFRVQDVAPNERESLIDALFNRLAEVCGPRAIGVVLSGTLSDGALGLRAIKAAGGVTFAQDEESAKYPSMPHAASAFVDLILSPSAIARRLPDFKQHGVGEPIAALPAADHQRILTMLRLSTGVNFSLYRQSTVKRRILRRMALARMDDFDAYAAFLREHDEELAALYEDILITVTAFFRDPATFDVLKKRVLPALLADRPPQAPIRVWVPGCSTGEEVYSLAIAVMEAVGELGVSPSGLQLFGTDISERAIDRARSGIYLESALLSVPAERRRRFFTRVTGGYQIAKGIRDICVFARQNVASDPPFSNLDLLSCRNLLIYLEPPLQSKVIRLFHYALKATGFLLLGGSESIGAFGELFNPFDRQHRIFRKAPGAAPALAEFSAPAPQLPSRETPSVRQDSVLSVDLQRRVDRLVLGAYAPPGVLVNENFDVLQFRGKTSPFLEPAPGAASLNVLKMARDGLMVELRSALVKARKTAQRTRAEGLTVRQDDGVLTANVEVVPVREEGNEARFYLVLFEAVTEKQRRPSARAGAKGGAPRPEDADAIAKLEQELAATKEYLQSIIEEQQASNEELKSANEEILSSNEELQSTNEELETTKEELQSTNEELSIVNEELHTRNEELSHAYNDIANLLSGLDLAALILNTDGTIRLLTGMAERVLGISRGEVGRSLWDLRGALDAALLRPLVQETIEHVRLTETELQTQDGRWYHLRVRPYRTADHRIEGVVMAFFDIDPLKRSLEEASRARAYAESLIETVHEGLVVLDEGLRVRSANHAFHRTFRTNPRQIAGQPLLEMHDWRPVAEGLRSRFAELLAGRELVNDIPLEMEIDGVRRRFVANLARLRVSGEQAPLTLVALDDVTERTRLEEELRQVQKLESIGTLAGGVAHDFNNILNIVSAHAALLRREKDDPERRQTSLNAVDGAVRRGSTLVRQLLTFARRSDAVTSIVRVNDIVRELVEMLRETFPKSVEIDVELDPAVPMLAGDPSQVHQALLNLCINARDAMPQGGRITLRSEVCSGEELRQRHLDAVEDRYVALRVSDSGVGMSEDVRNRIFEPFFTTKAKGLGNGLGLAVVYGIVNTHGGFIELETEPGKGTRFTLFLPVSASLENVHDDGAEFGPVKGGTETILVVEDEPSLRQAILAILEAEGYTAIPASDGPTALAAFEEHMDRLGAVVLDLGLPGFDGAEAFRRMRERSPGVKCVAMSGNLDREDRADIHSAGIAASIRKPFAVPELLRTLRNVLDA